MCHKRKLEPIRSKVAPKFPLDLALIFELGPKSHQNVFDTDVIPHSQKSLMYTKLSNGMKIWTALYFRWAKLKSSISKKGIKIGLKVPKKVLP